MDFFGCETLKELDKVSLHYFASMQLITTYDDTNWNYRLIFHETKPMLPSF